VISEFSAGSRSSANVPLLVRQHRLRVEGEGQRENDFGYPLDCAGRGANFEITGAAVAPMIATQRRTEMRARRVGGAENKRREAIWSVCLAAIDDSRWRLAFEACSAE
jgi:hypothetical protein